MQTKDLDNLDDLSLLKAMMKRADFDINEIFEDGKTLLHDAAIEKKLDCAQLLLVNGAEPNIKDKSSKRPLDYVIFTKTGINKDILNLLLKYHAIFDRKVFEAAFKNNLIELYAYYESDKNIFEKTDVAGNTAIFYAVANNNLEAIIYILACNGKVNVKNEQGITPLHIAACNNYLKLVDSLLGKNGFDALEDIDIDLQDAIGNTPLHYAISNGHYKMVISLLDSGASITIKNKENFSPFDLAEYSRFSEIKNLLKEDPRFKKLEEEYEEIKESCGKSEEESEKKDPTFDLGIDIDILIDEAKRRGDENTEQLLLKAVDEEKQETSNTEKMLTIYNNFPIPIGPSYTKIKVNNKKNLAELNVDFLNAVIDLDYNSAKKYLGQGANINVINSELQTALHLATFLGHEQLVQLCIDHKANPFLEDSFDHMPIDYAIQNMAIYNKLQNYIASYCEQPPKLPPRNKGNSFWQNPVTTNNHVVVNDDVYDLSYYQTIDDEVINEVTLKKP